MLTESHIVLHSLSTDSDKVVSLVNAEGSKTGGSEAGGSKDFLT